MQFILAGDIGGTNIRLGLFHCEQGGLAEGPRASYPSSEFPDLEDAVSRFLAAHPFPLAAASFGIAGPVLNGVVRTPNLPWVVQAEDLAKRSGTSTVGLLNDLEANAFGLGVLKADRLAVIQEGKEDPAGNAALISAGTGLGEAGLFFDGQRLRPMPSEGGHADFAPTDDLQVDLYRHLRGRFRRVSCERVLSGPGLANIFEFLTASNLGEADEMLVAASGLARGPALISEAGLSGASTRAEMALDLFVSIYGAAAGNLALTLKATRGLYIGGGIAPRILSRLNTDRFRSAFLEKGRMRPLLERTPVRVVLDDDCALRGAALHAALAAGWEVSSLVR